MLNSVFAARPSCGPLQVYLDSNDYSVFSDAFDKPSHPKANIFSRLLLFKQAGTVEFRFSPVHIVEIAHLDHSSRPMAVGRARAIRELCGGRCFRFWTETRVDEIAAYVVGQTPFHKVVSDDGQWFPDLSDLAISLRSMLVHGFEEALSELPLDALQKRCLTDLILKDGKLTDLGLRILLSQDRKALLDTLAEQFPLSQRFFDEDLMLKFVRGDVDALDICREFEIVFRDVHTFISWTFDRYDRAKELVLWLRELGGDIGDAISAIRKEVDDLHRPHRPDSKSLNRRLRTSIDANMLPFRRRALLKCIRGREAELVSRGVLAPALEKVLTSPLGSVPTVDALIVAISEYLKRNVSVSKFPRSVSKSDAGDLLHLSYLPYCDVFRADGETAQVAKRVAAIFGTRVVSRAEDLIAAIDDLLRDRAFQS